MTRLLVGLALGGLLAGLVSTGCPATKDSNGHGSGRAGDGGAGGAGGGTAGSGAVGGTATGGIGGMGGLGGAGGVAGGGGAGGATGGSGGTGPCYTCAGYQTDCVNSPPCPGTNEICGASQVVFNSWLSCMCGECGTQCALTCTNSGQDLVPDCATCKTTANSGTCTPHYAACLNDD